MTEIEPGVRRELPDERYARAMQTLEADLTSWSEENLLGRPSTTEALRAAETAYEGMMVSQGMEEVRARASRVWQCPMPLEPAPPTFYPGLEVEIRRNRGIAVVSEDGFYPAPMGNGWGKVDFVDGDRVIVRPYDRAELEVCLVSQLIPQGPPLERRHCGWKVGYSLWTRAKLQVFGNAGRCPLHGLHLQESIDVQVEGRLPARDMVFATVVVA